MNVGSFSANNTKDIKLKKSNVKVEEDNIKVYRSAVSEPNVEIVDVELTDNILPKKGEINFENIDFSRISTNSEDAKNGIFINENNILKDYWKNGEKLTYEVKADGTILIYKDGIAMGWTDEKGLKDLISPEPTENTTTEVSENTTNEVSEDTTNDTKENKKEKKYEDMTYEEKLNSGLDPTMNSKNPRLDYSRTTSDHWTKGEKVAAKAGVSLVAGILGPELAAAKGAKKMADGVKNVADEVNEARKFGDALLKSSDGAGTHIDDYKKGIEGGIKLLDDLPDINVAKEIDDFINFGNSL